MGRKGGLKMKRTEMNRTETDRDEIDRVRAAVQKVIRALSCSLRA